LTGVDDWYTLTTPLANTYLVLLNGTGLLIFAPTGDDRWLGVASTPTGENLFWSRFLISAHFPSVESDNVSSYRERSVVARKSQFSR
jgi:hypothetical protein